MIRLVRPRAKAPGATTGHVGQVGSSRSVVHKAKDGTETVLLDKQTPTEDFEAFGPAVAGVGLGLTIPGPDRSYKAARVDAFVYLPCEATPKGVREAMARASELVQERIALEAAEIQEYFNS
jgi:hypothetical protein